MVDGKDPLIKDPNNFPDKKEIKGILKKHKKKIKLSLMICAHCGLCAESCFMYVNKGGDPSYMPSHKVIHSIGKLYKKHGKLDVSAMEEIRDIVWKKCVLCTRCYCPLGLDIPEMIAVARSVCRLQGVVADFSEL